MAETALYRRQDLAAAPVKPFCLCGSEASADAAHRLIGYLYVACAWFEAPGAWQSADLTPLIGRSGLLIPDGTPDSRADMAQIAKRLHALGCALRVTSTEDRPEGWIIEDWTDTQDAFIAWAKAHTAAYEPPSATQAPPAWEDIPPAPEDVAAASRRRRTKPVLAAVDGNTALQQALDAAPGAQPLSQDALAEHFVDTYGDDWRYVAHWGRWMKWDADHWRSDDMESHVGLAKQVTRAAIAWPEAASITASDKRKVNSIVTAKALLSFARSDVKIAASTEQWDTDSMLLGVPGGVVDLRDGRMLPPERAQYISKSCAVAPANGRPALWLAYLDRVHGGDGKVIDYLQRYAGYCATGETKEHALAFLYGTGRNGKGVFLETISRVLGDYARTASMETFMEQKTAAHSTELARLAGARLVVTEEAASGGRWNEARIKHLTGGGKITAHYMRQDDFEFIPSFKLLIAANHKPMLRSVDEAIKSRIHLVAFNVTIPAEERDRDLLAKLQAEWPQILGWILDGCAAWQGQGLSVPQVILDATERYVEQEDVLGAWLEECCEREGETEGAILYENYRRWCDTQGEHAWSRRAWANTMLERGFEQRKSKGQRLFRGVRLRAGSVVAPGYPQD
ncbi:MAG: phage/plasmid primase, P4 family [Burkholderiales bacterium]